MSSPARHLGRVVAEAEAGALARAGEVARAVASVTVPRPAGLVAAVAADARGLVAKARALEG